MVLNREHLIKAKRSKRVELPQPLRWNPDTTIYVPNCNSSFFVEQLLYRINEMQTESVRNLYVNVLNTHLDKLNKEKIDDMEENGPYSFHSLDCDADNLPVYHEIMSDIRNPIVDGPVGVSIWINPTVLIPPLFIKSMMNVAEGSILKPLNYFVDDNMTRKIKLNEIWKKLWENVLWEVGELKGIDGLFCWSMHNKDILRVGGLPQDKKMNWWKFIDLLKKKQIKNTYCDMRVIKQYSIKFRKIEDE